MEGGWLLILGVALKRALDSGSERPACSIRTRGGRRGPSPLKPNCGDELGSGQ